MRPVPEELIIRLVLRWLVNALGLWLASELLPSVMHNNDTEAIVLTAVILTGFNAVLKPLLVIIALPAILVSLGLFSVFVNGLMVYVSSVLVSNFEIQNYGGAILAGIIISLLNYGLTTYFEERLFKKNHE